MRVYIILRNQDVTIKFGVTHPPILIANNCDAETNPNNVVAHFELTFFGGILFILLLLIFFGFPRRFGR